VVNLNTVLNERIARVARKEIKAQTGTTKKAAVRYRSDIAALKRQVQSLTKRLAVLERQVPKEPPQVLSEVPDGVRYGPRTARALRARLGLSAREFGELIGVSALTVYHWEAGKSRPRDAQLARLVAIRKIGRREAMRRLEGRGGGTQQAVTKAGRNRRASRQTAEEFVASLVKGRKATTSALINAAWKQDGRPGKADNTLSCMVRLKKLKRKKLKDQRGSSYAVA
jgi:DNA-binding transcriptional regulator YiaG